MSSYAERSAQAYSAAGFNSTAFRSPTTSAHQHQAPAPSSSWQQSHTPSRSYESPRNHTSHSVNAIQEQEQMRLLTDCLRHVQEHASLMRQALDKDDLPMVLDKVMSLLYILGDTKTHKSHLLNYVTTSSYVAQEASDTHKSTTMNKLISLSATNYYELHMRVCEELVLVEEYFLTFQISRKGYSLMDIFEMVQYCPRVVPRAYLRICCAAAILRLMKESTTNHDSISYHIGTIPFILKEISDTVKCLQCPIPGLFARYYSLQVLKDVLPDDDTKESDEDKKSQNTAINNHNSEISTTDESSYSSSVKLSYDFLISNFVEMNKLWIRIQHLPDESLTPSIQTPPSSSSSLLRRGNPPVLDAKQAKKKRERERNELRVLVGTNIVRLSQLEGVTSTIYGTIVLPKLLEHIVACRDPLAQAYLMDCIIQVFPDEYHIQTLEIFLSVCPKLREKVNIRTIIQSMMERLTHYFFPQQQSSTITGSEEGDTGLRVSLLVDSFHMFSYCVRSVIENRSGSIPLKDIVRLEATLMKYSMRCIPNNLKYIMECLENCKGGLDSRGALILAVSNVDQSLHSDAGLTLDDQAINELEAFLILPLGNHSLDVLRSSFYDELFSLLPWNHRMNVSRSIVKVILSSDSKLDNVNDLQTLLSLIVPLIQNEPKKDIRNGRISPDLMSSLTVYDVKEKNDNQPPNQKDEDHISLIPEDLIIIAQLIHTLDSTDTDTWFDLLNIIGGFIVKSGNHRQRYIIHSLIYAALRLIESIQQNEFPRNHDQVKNVHDSRCDEQTIYTRKINCRKVLVFIQSKLTLLRIVCSRVCFPLYLNAAIAADRCARLALQSHGSNHDFPAITYEFLTQALIICDECPMVESKQQTILLSSLIGTFLVCRCCDTQDYDNLSTKLAQNAARVISKVDQCKLLTKCAHMFYSGDQNETRLRNPQRSLECLQRALKIADNCVSLDSSNLNLLVDILSAYILFYEWRSPVINTKSITGLIALIQEYLRSCPPDTAGCLLSFKQVLNYIERKKTEPITADLFAEICS